MRRGFFHCVGWGEDRVVGSGGGDGCEVDYGGGTESV